MTSRCNNIRRFLPKRPGGSGLLTAEDRAEFLSRVIDGGGDPNLLAADYGITAHQAHALVYNWKYTHRGDAGIASAETDPSVASRAKRFLFWLSKTPEGQPAAHLTQLAREDRCSNAEASTALTYLEQHGEILRKPAARGWTITLCATGIVLRISSPLAPDRNVCTAPIGDWAGKPPIYEDDPIACRPEKPFRMQRPDRSSLGGISSYGQR